MIEMNVFDWELNRIAVIDDFGLIRENRSYTGVSTLTLTLAFSRETLALLQHNRILSLSHDPVFGYVVQRVEVVEEGGSTLEVTAISLNCLFWYRCIDAMTTHTGTPDQIIYYFIDRHVIRPENRNRIIHRLRNGTHQGEPFTNRTESTKTGGSLYEHLFLIAAAHDFCVDVVLDLKTKEFVAQTWKGFDRSTGQNTLPPVIFSKDFDNLISQTYLHDETGFRNCAVVAGEGEGVHRTKVITNDELAGLERREMFVNASDVRSELEDGGAIPPHEYAGMLLARGVERLSTAQKIITVSSTIDPFGQFVYGRDFSIGDRVTVHSTDLQIVLHPRIVSVLREIKSGGMTIKMEFGIETPTFMTHIRREFYIHGY